MRSLAQAACYGSMRRCPSERFSWDQRSREFMEKYPEIKLQVVLSDDLLDPIQDGFDVTLRIAELESSSLIARKITTIDRAICASPDYLARRGTPAHPRDLREHVSLTYGFLLTGNQWKLTGADGDHWILPSWSLCVNNAEVLRDVAIRGRGIALIPTFIAGDALDRGTLRAILTDYRVPSLAADGVSLPLAQPPASIIPRRKQSHERRERVKLRLPGPPRNTLRLGWLNPGLYKGLVGVFDAVVLDPAKPVLVTPAGQLNRRRQFSSNLEVC